MTSTNPPSFDTLSVGEKVNVIMSLLLSRMPDINSPDDGGAVGFSIGVIVSMSHPEWASAYYHWLLTTPRAPSQEKAKKELADMFIHAIQFEFITEREEDTLDAG